MVKLLLCLLSAFALGVITLQLRQQDLELRHQVADLQQKIQNQQAKLWSQQVEIARGSGRAISTAEFAWLGDARP